MVVDFIQGAHLLFVVLGMGPALYFDLRTLRRFSQPIAASDIAELREVHHLITAAFIGLWLSGAALIWVRTGFDTALFTPKLWCKVIVVTALASNAVVLSRLVIPTLEGGIGTRLIRFPIRRLLPMTVCGAVSFAGWMLALTLGSSSVLQTAGWRTLAVVLLVGAVTCILGIVILVFAARSSSSRNSNLDPSGDLTNV